MDFWYNSVSLLCSSQNPIKCNEAEGRNQPVWGRETEAMLWINNWIALARIASLMQKLKLRDPLKRQWTFLPVLVNLFHKTREAGTQKAYKQYERAISYLEGSMLLLTCTTATEIAGKKGKVEIQTTWHESRSLPYQKRNLGWDRIEYRGQRDFTLLGNWLYDLQLRDRDLLKLSQSVVTRTKGETWTILHTEKHEGN